MVKEITFGVMPSFDASGDLLGAAQLAEELGFHSVWLGDHVLWHVPLPDPFVQLAAIATVTKRVRLGISVYLAPLRTPAAVAKQAATLDLISGGRFIFGVGVGGENPVEFQACGVPMKQRGRRLDETIEICRLLWSGETVAYKGSLFSFSDGRLDIPTAQPGGPPIWVGGRSDAAARRAGRLGDGWLPYAISPERFADGWAKAREEAQRAGKDPDAVWPSMHVLCQLAPTLEQARDVIAPALEAVYHVPYERFEKYVLVGTPDHWLEGLQRYLRVRVRHFNLVFVGGDCQSQMLLFTKQVLPHVPSLL